MNRNIGSVQRFRQNILEKTDLPVVLHYDCLVEDFSRLSLSFQNYFTLNELDCGWRDPAPQVGGHQKLPQGLVWKNV